LFVCWLVRVCQSARASPLAFSPVAGQPRHFSDFPKNDEKCEMRVFRCYGTRSHTASSRRNTHRQVGSARASPLAFNPISIVTSISCAFTARSSLLQILRNSSRRHNVLMLLSMSSVTNSSLLFGFYAACMLSYKCPKMEWWAAGTVIAISSQPALVMWPCVSAARQSVLLPRASHAIVRSRYPADCVLPILVS